MHTTFPILLLIPAAVLFVCCVAQFPVFGALGRTLRDRHAEEWAKLRRSPMGWPFFDREFGFMFSGRYRDLEDPKLTDQVRNARRLLVVAGAAWALYALGIILWR